MAYCMQSSEQHGVRLCRHAALIMGILNVQKPHASVHRCILADRYLCLSPVEQQLEEAISDRNKQSSDLQQLQQQLRNAQDKLQSLTAALKLELKAAQ